MVTSEVTERLNPFKPFPLISYNLPFQTACAKHLKQSLHSSNPYIIISGSLSRKTTTLSVLQDALLAAGYTIAGVQKGMTPHTMYSEVLSTAASIRQSGADSILVVGGGSLVDGAKAMVFALANGADTPEKLHELLKTSILIRQKTLDPKDHDQKSGAIPIMCVTTTLSAGEFNPSGGATDDLSRHKQLFADPSPQAGMRVIAMDPALAVTAPERVWLSTGLRAVDHCVESICSSKPNEEGTAAALKGIGKLIPALLRTKGDPEDLDARLQAQLGAAESMKPWVVYGVPVGASHGIGHQIGPFGVPHAETTCIALPAVQKFNSRVNADRQAIVLSALWDNAPVAAVLARHSLVRGEADLGDALDVIIRELGFPRTLKEYGVSRDKLDVIAESSLKDVLCQLNVIPLTKKEQVLEILEMCYE